MKASKYNYFWEIDVKKKIAFNSFTNSLAEVNDRFFDILDNIDTIKYETLSDEYKVELKEMKKGHFIIEDNVDEIKLLKVRNYNGRYGQNRLSLTIAPTLGCNFSCPYCYETPKSGVMKEDVQAALLKMVEDSAKNKCAAIDLCWYGGEPLLAKNILYKLSFEIKEICDKYDMHFTNYIVSNGYLIDDDTVRKFKDIEIKGAQITLDGPPHIHNKRRKMKVGNEGTFDVILNNIKKLVENEIQPSIRINVDKKNENYVEELVDILIANKLNKVELHLGHVNAYTEACSSILENCLATEEYAISNYRFKKMLYKKGIQTKFYPRIKANYCAADNNSGYVIDPEGNMYKCWHEVGQTELAVGNITPEVVVRSPQRDMANDSEYMAWEPFAYEKCVNCKLLPICMGGCPNTGIRSGEPNCEFWKYSLEQGLRMTYARKIKRKTGKKEKTKTIAA